MLVPSLVLSLFYPYIFLVRPNKTRDIRNVGAQFGVESVWSIYFSYDPSPGRIFGFVVLHVLILQFTVFFWVVKIMSSFCAVIRCNECVCRTAGVDLIEIDLFVFFSRFVASLHRRTRVEQAPWHRRDVVVALPAGRPTRRGSRPSAAGSPSAAARRRRRSGGSPAGGGAGAPRRATTRSKFAVRSRITQLAFFGRARFMILHPIPVQGRRRVIPDWLGASVVVLVLRYSVGTEILYIDGLVCSLCFEVLPTRSR